jgi:hypothetical protein
MSARARTACFLLIASLTPSLEVALDVLGNDGVLYITVGAETVSGVVTRHALVGDEL